MVIIDRTDPQAAAPTVAVPDFETLYTTDQDPWKVRSSFYEQRKLDLLMACLGRQFYRAGWDPACGTGELALRLSRRCTSVLATDLAASAVRLSRHHCAGETGVTVDQLRLPDSPAGDGFDLVVLSEFMFYLDADARRATLTLVDERTAPESEIVSVHWRQHPHDAWLSGVDTESEIAAFLTTRGWTQTVDHQDEDFVLSCFTRPPLDALDQS